MLYLKIVRADRYVKYIHERAVLRDYFMITSTEEITKSIPKTIVKR